jgi:hypothetical protein
MLSRLPCRMLGWARTSALQWCFVQRQLPKRMNRAPSSASVWLISKCRAAKTSDPGVRQPTPPAFLKFLRSRCRETSRP